MTRQPPGWEPRFSLKALVVLVSLVCAYFGAWEMTKHEGVAEVTRYLQHQSIAVESSSSPAPFLVVVNRSMQVCGADQRMSPCTDSGTGWDLSQDRYYVWCGGPVFQLPAPLSEFCDHWYQLWDQLWHPLEPDPMSPPRVHGGVI